MHLVKIKNEIFNLDNILNVKYTEEKLAGEDGPILIIKSGVNSTLYLYGEVAQKLWDYMCDNLLTNINK